jgi:hypothetical protein
MKFIDNPTRPQLQEPIEAKTAVVVVISIIIKEYTIIATNIENRSTMKMKMKMKKKKKKKMMKYMKLVLKREEEEELEQEL